MPTEVKVLAFAALLQAAQILLMAALANAQLGPGWTAGPRDTPRELSGLAGRAKRAFDNHFEALTLFTIAVVVVWAGGASSPVTATLAWVYLVARIAYVPACISGVWGVRSVIWFAGFLATFGMILAAMA